MVVAEREVDLGLPWDAFMEEGLERFVREDPLRKERGLRQLRANIQGFRDREWPAIRRYLDQDYDFIVPDGLEPHWAAPGKAVYWQEQFVRHIVTETGPDGKPIRKMVEESAGWQPTKPLPCNNASAVNHYLRKGLRLRPPVDGVDVAYVSAASAARPQETEQQKEDSSVRLYTCDRHRQGTIHLRSWKAYLRHCDYYGEPPLEEPPASVLKRAKSYAYFCYLHGLGFHNVRAAQMHVRMEQNKSMRRVHIPLEQMRVQKGKVDART